jgi:hypothetical protein
LARASAPTTPPAASVSMPAWALMVPRTRRSRATSTPISTGLSAGVYASLTFFQSDLMAATPKTWRLAAALNSSPVISRLTWILNEMYSRFPSPGLRWIGAASASGASAVSASSSASMYGPDGAAHHRQSYADGIVADCAPPAKKGATFDRSFFRFAGSSMALLRAVFTAAIAADVPRPSQQSCERRQQKHSLTEHFLVDGYLEAEVSCFQQIVNVCCGLQMKFDKCCSSLNKRTRARGDCARITRTTSSVW